nr:transcription factor bHLH2 [Ganoderma lucidum]
MALFSPSESVYLTSFLSAVDLDSSISPDGSIDPNVAIRVPQLQGRETLAKATKDLMSLDIPVSSGHHHLLNAPLPSHIAHLPPNNPSYWPSVPGAEPGSSRLLAPLVGIIGTLNETPPANIVDNRQLLKTRPLLAIVIASSSSAAFPSAPDADATGSGPGTAARPRRSVATKGGGSPAVPASGSSTVNGGANGKGTLLSPSQKRANHIQSEQKRRANIRRGYESLCEVVPALREAIRAEEERERTKTRERGLDGFEEGPVDRKGDRATRGGGGGTEKGKKRKGRGEEKADGRAGPRSENVVLQKTIDYITGLIAERSGLQQRLELARNMLPPGHPALPVELGHLDPNGVPLWEREWNGGMDLNIADLGGAVEDDGASEDEG